jgi:hypothetical protein
MDNALTFRVVRTLLAGVLGALEALVILALLAVVGIPLLRSALTWYARGTPQPVPLAAAGAGREVPVRVLDASPAETRNIRRALGQLRYRVDPSAITFVVTDNVSDQPDTTGEYMPLLDVVRLERSIVRENGDRLEWTVAHEVGHYADQRLLSQADRAKFEQFRGIPAGTSWSQQGLPWTDRPIEDFAEVFADLSLPSVPRTPATQWGRVRNRQQMESFFRASGIRLGAEVPASDWAETARREVSFGRQLAGDPSIGTQVLVLVLFYTALGAVPAMARAWWRAPRARFA